MLELQKFILKNPNNWEDLLSNSPYYLKIKRKDGLVIFNYNQIKSDFSLVIVKESRGVILEEKTWRVVRLSFYKFFNYGEVYADTIDWSSVTVTEKVDGSIIGLYYYKGQWRVATNSTIDASDAPMSNYIRYKTFKDLFDAAWKNTGLSFSDLNTDYCYTMELVSPDNRVVIKYDKPELFLLSVRDMRTLKEIDVNLSISKPKIFNITTFKDCIDTANQLGLAQEGFVVKDRNNHRIKVKSPEYLKAHYLKNSACLAPCKIVDIVRNNEISEFLSYCPEYEDLIKNVQQQLNNITQIIDRQYDLISPYIRKYSNQKDFAQAIIKEANSNIENDDNKLQSQYLWLYFKFYKEENIQEYIEQMTSKQLIKTFNLQFT